MAADEDTPATQPELDVERNDRLHHEAAFAAMGLPDHEDEAPEEPDGDSSAAMKKPSAKNESPKGKGMVKGKGKGKGKTPDAAAPKSNGKPSAKSKTKAKAKPKSTPQPSVLPKGKGKGSKGKNGKGKKGLKRPASSVEDPKDEEVPMKKPSAKVPKKLAESFQLDLSQDDPAQDVGCEGDEGGEEEDPVEDDEVDPGPEVEEGRDRSKSKKFFQMLRKGSLPEAAKEAWGKCANRKEQTQMINTLYKSDGKNLIVQDRFALPKSYVLEKEMEKKERALERQEGYGKTIFMRKNALSEDDLQACLDAGEVVSWKSGDLTLFAATNQTFSQEASKTSKEKMASDKISLDKTTGRAFASAFEMLSPEVQSSHHRSLKGLKGPSPSSAESVDKLLRWHFKLSSCFMFFLRLFLLSHTCGLPHILMCVYIYKDM